MEETVPKVRSAADVVIKGLMVSLDRAEKGKSEVGALSEVAATYGFPTAAIVSMPEVAASLKERNLLDEDTLQRIRDYYAQYGAADRSFDF